MTTPSVAAHWSKRERSRAGLVAFGALLAGCSSLLGMDDLSTDPRPGSAGSGASAQAGKGTGGANGGAHNGGTGGALGGRNGAGGANGAQGGTGGSTGGSAGGTAAGGTAGVGTGGSAGRTGTTGGSPSTGGTGGSDAGDGPGGSGEGGSGNPTDSTVHGTVIDFWHHPLPNVPVAIGDATTTTDQSGHFTVDNVASKYDVSLLLHWMNPLSTYGWVFQDLSRRDPTLQVTQALDARSTHFYVTQQNGNFTNNSRWLLAFGSGSGASASSANSAGFDVRPDWQGPNANDWTLHSLFFELTGDLPASYTSYQTEVVPSTDTDAGHYLELDLSAQSLSSGNISGNVIQNTGVGRTNSVFVRFTSGGALPVVDAVDTSLAPYSYLVPQLANGSITVAAAEEDLNAGTYAIAHSDGRVMGDTGVDLQIPASATPIIPSSGSQNVNASTPFNFGAGDAGNAGYLVHIEDADYRVGIYVVTSRRNFTLGDLDIVHGQFVLTPSEWHTWEIQTHGKFANTDAMTNQQGFLDAFALAFDLPQGPANGDGSFTYSSSFSFKTAP